MRPKVESYDADVRLVVLRTARYDDRAEEVEFDEISVFLAPTFVITVRHSVASELRGAATAGTAARVAVRGSASAPAPRFTRADSICAEPRTRTLSRCLTVAKASNLALAMGHDSQRGR